MKEVIIHEEDDNNQEVIVDNGSNDNNNNNNNNNSNIPVPISQTTTTAASDDTDSSSTTTFVDYRRPPSIHVLPPSKYKLWLLVFVLVYLAVWVGELARFYEFLRFDGWFSPQMSQFLNLAAVVFVMVYGALDCTVKLLTLNLGDKQYGLQPWLSSKRITWVHQNRYADSFLVECLKGVVQILEEGFGMFNIPTPHETAAAAAAAVAATQHHQRRQRHRHSDNKNNNEYWYDDNDPQDVLNRSVSSSTHPIEKKCFTCDSDDCKTTLKIEHRVHPGRMEEYEKWQRRIGRAVLYAPGFLSIREDDIIEEECEEEEEEGEEDDTKSKSNEQPSAKQQQEQADDDGDVEKGIHNRPHRPSKKTSTIKRTLTSFRRSSTAYSTATTKTNLHTVYLTFDNIDSLNDWMMSPRREALMKQLEPLLVVPDHELIQAERAASARDAFTNLAIQQGSFSPTIAPKKWKVWWLTTVALTITVRWVESFLQYYLDFWGLSDGHPRLTALVSVFLTTFLNSYVLIPFLLFLFNPWMVRRPNEIDDRYMWKSLDDGLQSFWLKALLTFAFYGGCIITWIVRG
jgi:antibiotic biosynthesis monooxygenase (ABM) superfamily enzyme